jgi:hypothetical protein
MRIDLDRQRSQTPYPLKKTFPVKVRPVVGGDTSGKKA